MLIFNQPCKTDILVGIKFTFTHSCNLLKSQNGLKFVYKEGFLKLDTCVIGSRIAAQIVLRFLQTFQFVSRILMFRLIDFAIRVSQ